jgi:conjugative transposon TraN protein
MKQIILMSVFAAYSLIISAQNNGLNSQNKELTKEIPLDKVIQPFNLQVTYNKTVHIIFPAAVKYIDLGSANIIAGKTDAAENVVRIKAAVKDFKGETNFSVITDEGNFYSFNVRYSDELQKFNFEMKDFIHDYSTNKIPNNCMEIYFTELGEESPKEVNMIMKTIYQNDKKDIKNIKSKRFGVQFSINGIYIQDDILYFVTEIKNASSVSFDIDFIQWKIADKKVAKRTAIQETLIEPVRAFNNVTQIPGKASERTVFALNKFTIPDDKRLIVKVFEKNGERHQSFVVENKDIIKSREIDQSGETKRKHVIRGSNLSFNHKEN